MTRAEMEAIVRSLGATTRDLQATGRVMRQVADLLVTVSDHLVDIAIRTDAAIVIGLTQLQGEDEEAE